LELEVKANPDIKNTIALWNKEAIVYHLFNGMTHHLDVLATAILLSVKKRCLSLTKIESHINNHKIKSSFESDYDLIHAYTLELIKSEILITC